MTDDYLPTLEKGETPPPGFVGYSHDGHFIHHCHCGKFAPYGFGYFPKKGEAGRWFCREHRP
jgi:hypothetical protein